MEPGRCDPEHVSAVWIRETKVLMHPSLLEVESLCERAAAAHSPPADPNEYAERAIVAFVQWAEGCPPGKRPGLAPHKFAEHFGKVQRIVAGHEESAPARGARRREFREAIGHFTQSRKVPLT